MQHSRAAAQQEYQPSHFMYRQRPTHAQVQNRDSFNGDEWTTDATDSITGPDQTAKAHASVGDPNEIDPDTVDDGVNVQRKHHRSHQSRDTFDSDPNTVSPYDGMHGAEYHPKVFEGVQTRHHHKHQYQPREFENIMVWQDVVQNKTDAYDGDHNTVSQYDADKQHPYEKFVDKKADNKPTWSDKNAGSQYSAIQVNSTTNATLVSNISKNVTANQTANITSNMSANVTGNQTLAFVNKTANITANQTVFTLANVSVNATSSFTAANQTSRMLA